MSRYEFYTSNFHGALIPAEELDYYADRAQEQLEEYKRAFTVTEPKEGAEEMAVYAMAEALYSFDAAMNASAGVSSASIGSVSTSYSSPAGKIDISPAGQERELYRCARRYLDIYRGCG